ncbi:MAG: formyltransferase family protein [Candidatus Puniceispirillaceae bacterium]
MSGTHIPVNIVVIGRGSRFAAVKSCLQTNTSTGRQDHFWEFLGKAGFENAQGEAIANQQILLQQMNQLSGPVLVIIANLPIMLSDAWLELNCVILHGGRVPDYRGASVINWQMINGETEIGLSALRLADTLDGGAVLGSASVAVKGRPLTELRPLIDQEFTLLVMQVIARFQSTWDLSFGAAQDPDGTVWPKRRPDDSQIELSTHTTLTLQHFIHGHEPDYAAFIARDNDHLRLFGPAIICTPEQTRNQALMGAVTVTDEGVYLQLNDGLLCVADYQIVAQN